MKFLTLEETGSTNSYADAHARELEPDTMIIARTQTAGRGQRGNSWEAEPGKNLTFTLFHRPADILPTEQFAISEATALAVCDALAAYGIEAKVKWPNDIYVGDRKICGLLIEHSVLPSRIEHSRIGAGINVNQTRFLSDAPNPVSMKQILNPESDIDLGSFAESVYEKLLSRLRQAESPDTRQDLHREFTGSMWRFDGKPYPFRRRGEQESFPGIIVNVDSTGPISIKDTRSGAVDSFIFKEIEFIL